MEQYISKSAVAAEIKKMEKHSKRKAKEAVDVYWQIHFDGWVTACRSIMSFLDTLEVKEVDLEKEYEEFVVDDPILGNFITNDTMGMELAKYFFKLGLNTAKKYLNHENLSF